MSLTDRGVRDPTKMLFSGRQGAQPKPQFPIPTSVTPCRPESVQ